MKRHAFVGLAATIAVVIGVVTYAATRPAPAKAPAAAITLTGTSYTERGAYYDIVVNYASSTPLLAEVGPAADTAAIAAMKAFVSGTIAQFKTDGNFANLTQDNIQGRKETLQITYLIASSAHTISYIFTTYEDTLGAHGNMFFQTFTFDTTTGAPLALADLFAPGADYLGTLSSISRAELPNVIGKSADTGFIERGTTPEDKNFSDFFFDNRQLVILFAPYAVAPYSSGPQTLRIPVSELSSILKPVYR